MGEDRGERIARNEVAYRDVNEAIRAGRRDAAADALHPFMCECGLLECNDLLELTLREYEAVRQSARQFFCIDGHDVPDVESVVERHERYIVVEKHAAEAQLAEQTDPRAGS